MSDLFTLIKLAISFIPFILLVVLNRKNNLKKKERSRQILMPAVAFIYAVVLIIFLSKVIDLTYSLMDFLAEKLSLLSGIGGTISGIVNSIIEILKKKTMFTLTVSLNVLAMLVFMGIKKVFITIFRTSCVPGSLIFDQTAPWFYEPDEKDPDEIWYVKESTVEARRYLGIFYMGACIISVLALLISMYLYENGLLELPFFPVLGIIIIGELCFYLDGITKEEALNAVEGEHDASRGVYDYSKLRRILRKLFGDKLLSSNTTAHTSCVVPGTAEELIEKYLQSDSRTIETYGKYMNRYRLAGHVLDQNYLASGLDLLEGKSILFGNPFYYDLIPYVFYAMNHRLLAHKKILIILGRHGVEDDVMAWCESGLRTITNVAGMWRIGILGEQEQELDVGIIIRSDVQNLRMHKANMYFFEDTEFVVLIEPSKLLSTAQIGLNSIIRRCKYGENKKLTFCSTDKNCDGLIDALSHALMTSLCEVSSTEVHEGVCSYMLWTTDSDYWQHRMLPNISRYLGSGTELSFVALKNSISRAEWYGGERFPVTDMHWITKQYYGELLQYAGLQVSQELFDDVFRVSPNLWNVKKEKNYYLTVEDEANNLFEMKREFSTRTTEQNFVNIITQPYLLCDYMAENEGIFNADSKAIPYIVADYAMTKRNVLFRLCVQMAAGYVWEADVRRELLLADAYGEPMIPSLWKNFCVWYNKIGEESDTIRREVQGKICEFRSDVIKSRQKYNVQTGCEETAYYIEDENFVREVLGELSNARYIAEEENEKSFIGAEILGQVFQRHLPGQFFTLCGKYYEMLSVTYDGRILVRRAADHISGRPVYRQERFYHLHQLRDDMQMGSKKTINQMEVIRSYADISVDTPAYWELGAYQDFAHGRRVELNGIPTRSYNNKMILQIRFEGIEDSVRYTLALMLNEVFRTVFAENQDMIVAVTPGVTGIPLTYGLDGAVDQNSIYLIEDCQYDIGLLTAAERNIVRIFQIVCDYLQWNQEAVVRSDKEEENARPDFTMSREEAEKAAEEASKASAEKKKGFFGRLWEKIKNLFKKKPKPDAVKEKPETVPEAEAGEGEVSKEAEADTIAEEKAEAPEQAEKTEEVAEEAQEASEDEVAETVTAEKKETEENENTEETEKTEKAETAGDVEEVSQVKKEKSNG